MRKNKFYRYIQPSSFNLFFAFLVYLNDVKEGGETEFLYANLKIQPKKGTLLVHPAGYPYFHKGNVPVSDDKYILVSVLSYNQPN